MQLKYASEEKCMESPKKYDELANDAHENKITIFQPEKWSKSTKYE